MIQYMKRTTLDNPEIEVKDERLIELDRIVREVKESEEWEAVKMNILEVGIERGKEIGLERGKEIGLEQGKETGEKKKLLEQVCKKIKKGLTVAEIADMLEEPEEKIQEICEIAEKYAPEYNIESILKEL